MSGYERMRRILRWLDDHFRDQPSLRELADLAGLSETQLHREFVRWTGVTPKDFLQCLTVGHARHCLEKGANVLEASLDSGLSGPGRLHDLCVSLEAATPGEIRRGGDGLEIRWGIAESPFGLCLAGETDRGLCHVAFLDSPGDSGDLAARWPMARLSRSEEVAERVAASIFSDAQAAHLRAWVRGTTFQVKVWRALLSIPPGELTTYRRIAEAIGQPDAARAVGTAIGSNPLALLIPCHRVIRETGAISGYRWGAGRKRGLIAWEGAAQAGLTMVSAPS